MLATKSAMGFMGQLTTGYKAIHLLKKVLKNNLHVIFFKMIHINVTFVLQVQCKREHEVMAQMYRSCPIL